MSDIARMLDLSRQRIHQIVRDDETFPEPVDRIGKSDLWLRTAVARWDAQRQKRGMGRG
jgi:predicted DNA-binding transcriptional regulator AlpA